MSEKYGRDAKLYCKHCGRRLKTLRSQKMGLCVVCLPPDVWGEPQSLSQFER